MLKLAWTLTALRAGPRPEPTLPRPLRPVSSPRARRGQTLPRRGSEGRAALHVAASEELTCLPTTGPSSVTSVKRQAMCQGEETVHTALTTEGAMLATILDGSWSLGEVGRPRLMGLLGPQEQLHKLPELTGSPSQSWPRHRAKTFPPQKQKLGKVKRRKSDTVSGGVSPVQRQRLGISPHPPGKPPCCSPERTPHSWAQL